VNRHQDEDALAMIDRSQKKNAKNFYIISAGRRWSGHAGPFVATGKTERGPHRTLPSV
jgi:hypothetical protein